MYCKAIHSVALIKSYKNLYNLISQPPPIFVRSITVDNKTSNEQLVHL